MALDLSTYKLTFQDEFTAFSRYNGTAGSGTWKTWFNYNDRTLTNNGEIQMYMDPDFKGLGVNPFGVSADPNQAGDGVLNITAKPADAWVKPYINNYAYTSGLITTQATFAQQYGYFEMRAKLPEGKGLWPAFWLLPTAPTWPPEIDVIEAFGGPNSRGEGGSMSYHWGEISTQAGASNGDWVTVPGVNFYQEYHTFGVDWQRDYITYYLDGQQVGRVATPTDMHQPMYMLANIAVGGSWAESPPAGTTGTMQIDYIRAYSNDPNAVVYADNTGMSNPSPTTGTSAALPSLPSDTTVVKTTGAITNWLAAGVTTGTAGNDSLTGQWGDTQTFRGGLGDDTYGVASRGMQIVEKAGEGIDTASAWVSYALPAYVENIVVGANYGIAITGNDGANMLRGNVGNDTMTGKGGKDLFVMEAGGGQDIITDFKVGEDQVKLEKYPFADFAAVKRNMSESGGNVVLTLGTGESLTFQGHKIADFSGLDFGFPGTTTPPPTTTPPTTTPPSGPTSTIVVRATGDSWNGAPQFQLYVDGKAVGTAQNVTAVRANGAWQDITFTGDFGSAGPGKVEVRFLNDSWGGSSATDRNLFVDYIDVNGKRFQAESAVNTASAGYDSLMPNAAEMLNNGSLTFTTTGSAPSTGTTTPPPTTSPPPTTPPASTTSTITVRATGDSWNGAPQFQLFVDGKAVGAVQDVTASRAGGVWQDISFNGDFGTAGPGKVEVRFLNDSWGGSAATDRNLFVDYIDVNGQRFQAESAVNTASAGYDSLMANAAEMLNNGSLTFTTTGAAPASGTGSSGGSTTPPPATGGAATPPATTEPTVAADMAKLSAGTQTGYYVTNAATQTATGTSGNDHIWSNGSGQTLVGNGGDDLFHIGTNTDAKIVQSTGLATVETWAGNYTLASGAHNIIALGDYAHTLTGNALNNAIVGSNGVDTINGGAGNDMLIGGGGKDILYGGAGKDLFAFRAMAEAGDTVKDFVRGEDLIDLRTLMKAMNVATDPVAAGIVKFADAGAGTVISIDADGAGAGAAVALVTIENTKVNASDYVWH